MSKFSFIPIIILFAVLFYSCSASTDTRYSKDSEKDVSKSKEKEAIVEDDFDIKPFQTKIEIPDETLKTVIDTISGYRVQVISTDNLEEANGVRSEIYFKTNEKAIYVIFEPPFYVVRVGDYKNINDAKALSFKLKSK